MDPIDPPGATPLDPSEAEGLIPRLATIAELNAFEAQNIAEALLWSFSSRSLRQDLLTISGLKLLHKHMFDKTWRWAGQFRQTQKSIGVDSAQITSQLKALTDDVKFWIEHETYGPDEVVARFHHRLVWIHPFPNGNGRHARFAADLMNRQLKRPPLTWGTADLTRTSGARDRYLSALKAADNHNLKPLLEFVRS